MPKKPSATRPAKPPAPSPESDKRPGQAVRIPGDVYEDLLRLQAIYLGKSLGEIAELLIRRGLAEDEELLSKLRTLPKK